jgi:hypothetical protein
VCELCEFYLCVNLFVSCLWTHLCVNLL